MKKEIKTERNEERKREEKSKKKIWTWEDFSIDQIIPDLKNYKFLIYQITDPAVEAILGHKSAASLATGPVI